MSATAPARQLLSIYAKLNHGMSEFIAGDFVHNGMCTQASLEMSIAAIAGRAPSSANMLHYAVDMHARNDVNGKPLAASNGGTSIEHIAWYAANVLKQRIALQWNYHEPLPFPDWRDMLRERAGIWPILLQVAKGMNLIDCETKIRDEAAARGLQYHAIIVVGKQQNGYICCDPDHPQVTQRFQIYNLDTLDAAVPCGALVLDYPLPAPKPLPVPTFPKPLPPDPTNALRQALLDIQTRATSALKG